MGPSRWLAACGVVALLLAGCSSDDDSTATSGNDAPGTTASASGPSDTSGSDTPAQSGEFTLLSYNVAGLPQEISGENPEVNIPLISPRLEPYDIVVTQEDFDWWQPDLDPLDFANYHTRLRAEVTHPHRSEQHPGPEAVGLDWENDRPTLFVGDGLGFLSRFPLRDIQRVPWEGCFGGADTSDRGAGDCLAMKGFAVATVELAPGVEIDVYTLHVEAGATEEDQRLQGEQMEQLTAFIAEHSEGRAVIIAGDTNLHTNSDHADGSDGADTVLWEDFLEATGMVDVCIELDCDRPSAIDKAAYRSGGGVTLEALEHRFANDDFLDDAGEDLSDHPPLEVRFRWSTS